jgi:hypothetical protein
VEIYLWEKIFSFNRETFSTFGNIYPIHKEILLIWEKYSLSSGNILHFDAYFSHS